MINFPFPLEDTESLLMFVTAIVPGSSRAVGSLAGGGNGPGGDGILQEGGGFILQEDGDFILQE